MTSDIVIHSAPYKARDWMVSEGTVEAIVDLPIGFHLPRPGDCVAVDMLGNLIEMSVRSVNIQSGNPVVRLKLQGRIE